MEGSQEDSSITDLLRADSSVTLLPRNLDLAVERLDSQLPQMHRAPSSTYKSNMDLYIINANFENDLDELQRAEDEYRISPDTVHEEPDRAGEKQDVEALLTEFVMMAMPWFVAKKEEQMTNEAAPCNTTHCLRETETTDVAEGQHGNQQDAYPLVPVAIELSQFKETENEETKEEQQATALLDPTAQGVAELTDEQQAIIDAKSRCAQAVGEIDSAGVRGGQIITNGSISSSSIDTIKKSNQRGSSQSTLEIPAGDVSVDKKQPLLSKIKIRYKVTTYSSPIKGDEPSRDKKSIRRTLAGLSRATGCVVLGGMSCHEPVKGLTLSLYFLANAHTVLFHRFKLVQTRTKLV